MASHTFNLESTNPPEVPTSTPTSTEIETSPEVLFSTRVVKNFPLLKHRHEPMGSERQVLQSSTVKKSSNSSYNKENIVDISCDTASEEVDDISLRVKALLEDSDDIPPLSTTKPRVLASMKCDMNIETIITPQSVEANISDGSSVSQNIGKDDFAGLIPEALLPTEYTDMQMSSSSTAKADDPKHYFDAGPSAAKSKLKLDVADSLKLPSSFNIDRNPYCDSEHIQKSSKAIIEELSDIYSVDDVKSDKKDTEVQMSNTDPEFNLNSFSSLSEFDQMDRETPPLSASSMASSKRLEWDNGADIGYSAVRKKINVAKNVPKIFGSEPEGVSLISEKMNKPTYSFAPSTTSSQSSVSSGMSRVTSVEQNTLLSGQNSFVSGIGASNISTCFSISKDKELMVVDAESNVNFSSNLSQRSNSNESVVNTYIPVEDVISSSDKEEVSFEQCIHVYDSYGESEFDDHQDLDNDVNQANSERQNSENYDIRSSGYSFEYQPQDLSLRPLFVIKKNISEVPEYVGHVYCSKNVTEFSCSEDNPHIRWYPFASTTDVQDIRDVSTQTAESFMAEQLEILSPDSSEEKLQTSASDFNEVLDEEKKNVPFQESSKYWTIAEMCNMITRKEDVSERKDSQLISFRHYSEYSSDSDDKENDIQSLNANVPSIKSFLSDKVDEKSTQSSILTKYEMLRIHLKKNQYSLLECMEKQKELNILKEGKNVSVINQTDAISHVADDDKKWCFKSSYTLEDSASMETDSSGKPADMLSVNEEIEMQSDSFSMNLESISTTPLNVQTHIKTYMNTETDKLPTFSFHREKADKDFRNILCSATDKTTERVLIRKTRKTANLYLETDDPDIQDESYSTQIETEVIAPLNVPGRKQAARESLDDSALKSAKQKVPDTLNVSPGQSTRSALFQLQLDKPLTEKSDIAMTGVFKGSSKDKNKINTKGPIWTEQLRQKFLREKYSSFSKVKKTMDCQSTSLVTNATSRETMAKLGTSPVSDFTRNYPNSGKSLHTSFDINLCSNNRTTVKDTVTDNAVLSGSDTNDRKDSSWYASIIPRSNKSVGIQVNDPNELSICEKCHRRKYSEYCHCAITEQCEQFLSSFHEENPVSPPCGRISPNVAFTIPQDGRSCIQNHSLFEALLIHRPWLLKRSQLRQVKLKSNVSDSSEPSNLASKIPRTTLKITTKVEHKIREPRKTTITKKPKPNTKERDKVKPIKRAYNSAKKEKKMREDYYKKNKAREKLFSMKLAKAAAAGKVNYQLNERVVPPAGLHSHL